MRIRLFPYNMGSKSSKTLSIALGILRVHPDGRYIPRQDDIIINWGNSKAPAWENRKGTIINSFLSVRRATNKLTTLDILSRNNVPVPDWTQHSDIAQDWVVDEHRVYGRQTLTGHSGQGIIIFNENDIVTGCPLYTKNTKAKYEYRVHVMAGKVIDVQQKRKREGFEGGIAGIRNFANGWVFCRENIVIPNCVKEVSIAAVSALSLDFGAVDVGYVEREDKAYVYEVNTAPGIEGTTLQRYVAGFKENYLA